MNNLKQAIIITYSSVYVLDEQINATDLLEALICRTNNICVLAAISSTLDFINFDEIIMQHYFWMIGSFAYEPKEVMELLSNKLSID